MRPDTSSTAQARDVGRLPDFLIIGAMKSGTSTLRANLDAHPDVFCAREQHFFNLHYGKGTDWYRAKFAGAGDVRLIGEKCPEYLHNPVAVDRMASLLPDARLIVLLRDPVERAYSHYWQERRIGKETLEFADAVAAEPRRIAEGATRFSYIDRGRYLAQLERICQRYPRDALLVLVFEELREAPSKVFGAACRFLGIDDTFLPPAVDEVRNPYRTYRPQWLFRALAKNDRWRKLPPGVAVRIQKMMTRQIGYPAMDAGLRRQLEERFRDENRALAAWLGRDLSVWSS